MKDTSRIEAEIDLDAIEFNIKSIRKRTNPQAKLMGVVKADGYGHGAVQVSEVLIKQGVDYLAVGTIDEAISLRNHGISVPVLILGYTPYERFGDVIDYHITQAIFSYEQAQELSKQAQKRQKNVNIHIKIDTGMGRLGFCSQLDSIRDILSIKSLPYICLEGIFTHFSTADEIDKTFTLQQYDKFSLMIKELEKKGISFSIRHASNSAGIIDFDNLFCNMVRPGIILYGLYPSQQVKKENLPLRPAMKLKSHISFLKLVEENTSIGYGNTYYTKKPSKIATIPVGYADGYLRKMQNGGRVLIHGMYAPIVGRICMDQFMVDVTDIQDVSIGDEVILLGQSGRNIISAEEIASIMETIHYEVICMVSKRVPRVYLKNNEIVETVNYIN